MVRTFHRVGRQKTFPPCNGGWGPITSGPYSYHPRGIEEDEWCALLGALGDIKWALSVLSILQRLPIFQDGIGMIFDFLAIDHSKSKKRFYCYTSWYTWMEHQNLMECHVEFHGKYWPQFSTLLFQPQTWLKTRNEARSRVFCNKVKQMGFLPPPPRQHSHKKIGTKLKADDMGRKHNQIVL